MKSLRLRLFVILLVATGIIWLSAVGWIYFSTRQQVEKVLDARLREAAHMVDSLITDRRIDIAGAVKMGVEANSRFELGDRPYERQLSCQIWSLNGNLVGRSDGAPQQALSTHDSGFQQTVIDGETWRVYAVVNKSLGVRVLVGDSLQVRRKLIDDVIKGLLLPAALILPALAALIWLSVGRGLLPLRRLASGLAGRSAADLHPLATEGMATELLPVSRAMNGLFGRLRDARERERSFAAYAAHELKTPLAGLRTQAQIALGSNRDRDVRDRALVRIVEGVDRTSRLVRQLLDLAEAEADRERSNERPEPAADVMQGIVADLAPVGGRRGVRVRLSLAFEQFALHDRLLFTLAMRNVLENALQHSPEGEVVDCDIEKHDARFVLRVADRGPGMSEEDLAHAYDRFYRSRHARADGTGLGLSIARAAVERMGGSVCLENREPSGLVAHVLLPLRVFQRRERAE